MADFQENWRTVRNASLMALKFPYEEYRKGQRELAVNAYKTIRTKQNCSPKPPLVLTKRFLHYFQP